MSFEVQSTTTFTSPDTWIAKLDVSYSDAGEITDVTVDLLKDGNPAIASSTSQSFPFLDRVGDTIYITAAGGETHHDPNLYKISIVDFLNHNFASGIEYVRSLVSHTENTDPDGNWNGDFHSDPCWINRGEYQFLFVSLGRTSDKHHNIHGVWYTKDRENGDLTLHPDAPIHFGPYSDHVVGFPLDLGRDILMWDQRIDVRRITTFA